MKTIFVFILFLSFFFGGAAYGLVLEPGSLAPESEFETWIDQEVQVAIEHLMSNAHRPDAVAGTIVASPSRFRPNYYFHWVRDASVAMSAIFLLLNAENDSVKKETLQKTIEDFILLTQFHQTQETPYGLGEVKFLPSGVVYTGPWGRPQTDGPAIRALVLTFYAQWLLQQGEEARVRAKLYKGEWPATTVIKRDLEYVAQVWAEPSFDIWEEVIGAHFFNRYVQAQALYQGGLLAARLGDAGAAAWYHQQSTAIIQSLKEFWSPENHQINATLNLDGQRGKVSNLDVAVILGVMAVGSAGNHFFGVTDDRTVATVWKLRETFRGHYAINQRYPNLPPAIGRYPEDAYDGYTNQGIGNPWFLTTGALASYSFRLAWALQKDGRLLITENNESYFRALAEGRPTLLNKIYRGSVLEGGTPQFNELFKALKDEGDGYLKRMRFHMGADGSMSEQFNRDSGYMQGACHLTMSYTAFLRAICSRRNLLPF